jgi:hypothetical protein
MDTPGVISAGVADVVRIRSSSAKPHSLAADLPKAPKVRREECGGGGSAWTLLRELAELGGVICGEFED